MYYFHRKLDLNIRGIDFLDRNSSKAPSENEIRVNDIKINYTMVTSLMFQCNNLRLFHKFAYNNVICVNAYTVSNAYQISPCRLNIATEAQADALRMLVGSSFMSSIHVQPKIASTLVQHKKYDDIIVK